MKGEAVEKKDVSVYIHIPFSIKIRRGDNTLVINSTREIRNQYLDALEREMTNAGDVLDGRRITSICIGGGIATTVSPDKLARIMIRFKRQYDVAPRAEISVTAAPQTLVTPCLSSLNMFNINRISLVAYSPVDALLETIDAPHRLSDIENGSALLVKFGFQDIDAVLMYGIPGQTATTIRNTIIAFTSVKGFQHITLKPYELSAQCGVNDIELDNQYRLAVDVLADRNLIQYSAGRFAVDGKQSLFTLNELLGVERVGFGLGARSFIDNLIYENTTNFNLYVQNANDFSGLVSAATEMNTLELMKRFVALRLQLVQGFRETDFVEKFGCLPVDAMPDVMARLVENGFVESDQGSIHPTMKGLRLSTDLVQTIVG